MAGRRPTPAERLALIPGIGPALARDLARRGFRTRADLRRIADDLPRETQAHVRFAVTRPVTKAVADDIAGELRERLTFVNPATGRRKKFPVIAVGSVRRRAPRSKDIDMLVVAPDELAAARTLREVLPTAALREAPGSRLSIADSYASGARRHSFILRRTSAGARRFYAVDLFLATRREKPFALFHFTGGRQYNIRVRAHAKRSGRLLNQYGVFVEGRRAPGSSKIRTERDLTRFLGVTFRRPADRS